MKVATMGVNKRPVEVGFSKQASKLALSLEVSLFQVPLASPGVGAGGSHPNLTARSAPLLEGVAGARGEADASETCRPHLPGAQT